VSELRDLCPFPGFGANEICKARGTHRIDDDAKAFNLALNFGSAKPPLTALLSASTTSGGGPSAPQGRASRVADSPARSRQ
jgi:hypothetical protein